MSDPFGQLVAEAYRVLRYPNPTDPSLSVCDCCMAESHRRNFLANPASALPLESVREWYNAALQPSAIPKSFCGFLLPRLFELLAQGQELAIVGNQVVLSRYPVGDRQHWSDDEWRIIDGFRRAYVDWHREPRDVGQLEYDALDDILCMFGRASWPAEDLIAQVDSWPDAVIARRLWQDWCAGPGHPVLWLDTFWTGESPILRWYTSSSLYDRMVALGLGSAADAATRDKALAVADVIRP